MAVSVHHGSACSCISCVPRVHMCAHMCTHMCACICARAYVQCGAVRCGAVWCGAVRCGAMPCRAMPCHVVPCRAMPCRACMSHTVQACSQACGRTCGRACGEWVGRARPAGWVDGAGQGWWAGMRGPGGPGRRACMGACLHQGQRDAKQSQSSVSTATYPCHSRRYLRSL